MRIKVLYDGLFAEITGCREELLELRQGNLAELVATLGGRHGKRFQELVLDSGTDALSAVISLLVNGQRQDLGGELKDGDEVAFLMPFAGG